MHTHEKQMNLKLLASPYLSGNGGDIYSAVSLGQFMDGLEQRAGDEETKDYLVFGDEGRERVTVGTRHQR
jgi:hypothetical protein